MKPHLIVLDLDGTLLTDEKVISPTTKETILQAKSVGHQVMIATGRPFRASKHIYEELGLHTPIVNFNGAYIHQPHHTHFKTQHNPIQLHTATDIVESLHEYRLANVIAEVMDDVYVEQQDDPLLAILGMGNPRMTYGKIKEHLKDDPTSLLLHASDQEVAIIREFLEHTKAEVIDHRRWGDPYHVIEIVRSGIHKAIGLEVVSKHLQIPKERIIAFGDEDNDLEMLEYAGLGVAMGNAIGDVKNIANEITDSNNEDGIARILRERLKL